MKLPHKFTPRKYQYNALIDAIGNGKKRLCCVWHRRSGKDKTFLNLIVCMAITKKGNYVYLFPETTHAKKVIWHGIDSQGNKFLDHFPPEIIASINNTDMMITLINGSTFQLMGSERYDKLRGINPLGVVFSEYQEHHPAAWETLRPIFAENDGWVVFQGTPKGQNHLYDVYQYAKDNPAWHCSLLTINDTTRDLKGTPVISNAVIEEERASGMPEEMIQQEYFCSFAAAITGAYYGKIMEQLQNQGHIFDFEIEKSLPVYTFWDLGIDDANAIWFMQYVNGEIHLIYYYEDTNKALPDYVAYINNISMRHQIRYAEHFAPHDIQVREYGTGRSRIETARDYGLYFRIAPNISIIDGINAVRMLLPRMYFHKTNCKMGIRCLMEYHREYDTKRKCYGDRPAHDWSSHGADAMRYLAVSWQDYFSDKSRQTSRKLQEFQP